MGELAVGVFAGLVEDVLLPIAIGIAGSFDGTVEGSGLADTRDISAGAGMACGAPLVDCGLVVASGKLVLAVSRRVDSGAGPIVIALVPGEVKPLARSVIGATALNCPRRNALRVAAMVSRDGREGAMMDAAGQEDAGAGS